MAYIYEILKVYSCVSSDKINISAYYVRIHIIAAFRTLILR